MIVDSADDLFVAACIYNNTSGDADERVLKSFDEPAWNNPVVRIIDAGKKDIVPRMATEWTVEVVARGMVDALKEAGREPPPYLALLSTEESARARPLEQAVFAMD